MRAPGCRLHGSARVDGLPQAPTRHIHQPAGLQVLGQLWDAIDHDDVGGAGGMELRSTRLKQKRTGVPLCVAEVPSCLTRTCATAAQLPIASSSTRKRGESAYRPTARFRTIEIFDGAFPHATPLLSKSNPFGARMRGALRWQSLCRKRAASPRQPEAFPYIDHRVSERVDQRVIVIGRRRNP